MSRCSALLPFLLVGLLARGEHPLIYTSPARFADEVAEAAFAGGAGGEAASPKSEVRSPESEVRSQQLVVDRSTLIRTLADFPQDFLDGLVAEERNGYVSFPISVRIDPASGCALFENAAGRVFYAIAPVAGNPAAPVIPAGNVVMKWRVLPEDFNTGTPRLRTSDSGLLTLAPDTLRLSSIVCSTNGVAIGAAWPASDAPTNGVLDLYFSTHLDRDWRVLKTMTIPAGATNLATFLAIDDIPSYTNRPPAHVHDADCHIVTNITPNIFSGGAVVTNIHWSCAGQRTPPYEGDSGFFRLGTRIDTDGDGLPDAYETIVSGTDPLLPDTDGDGLFDSEEDALGTNPLSADSDGDHLQDLWEVWNDTNPLDSADGLSDDDGDGLPFWREVLDLLTDPDLADTDGDGLSDSWEEDHLTDPNDRDSDWDGLTDGMEVALGTNPLSRDSDGDGLHDAWEWSVDGFNPLDSLDAESDWDGDGLSNGGEANKGSNWLVADTDGDGISDGMECLHDTNPLLSDTDGDGLSDAEEPLLGTSPCSGDTDGDGCPDGWEVQHGFDPLDEDDPNTDADPDADHLSHGREASLGTSPFLADTDGDGLSDSDEVGWASALSASPFDTTGATNLLASISDPDAGEISFSLPFPITIQNRFVCSNIVIGIDGMLNLAMDDGYLLHSSADAHHPLVVRAFDDDLKAFPSESELRISAPTVNGMRHFVVDYRSFGFPGMAPNPTNAVSFQVVFAEGQSDEVRVIFYRSDGDATIPMPPRALGSWAAIGAKTMRTDVVFSENEAVAIPGREVRFHLGSGTDPLRPDTDSDGILDALEVAAGMDARAFDMDGDGIPDGWEAANHLNPGDPDDALLDPDQDGLSNIEEYRNGTNPLLADTDGDGVSDGAEVTQGSDPNDVNDGGVAPDAENFVDLPFHIYGDWAAWRMNIEGLTGDSRTFRFHTDAPGDSETRTLRLLRGNAYRVTMDWLGSDPHRNPYWFCWEAQFGNSLTPNTQSFKDYNPSRLSGDRWLWGEGWIADNADGLLSAHVHTRDGEGGNIAEGKEAVLYIPKADLAIYRLDATTPVNALYEGSEGSIVRILDPNRGEIPGTGRAAGCALRIDSTFSDAGLPGATATLLLHPVPTDLRPPLVRLYRETAGGGLSLVLSNTDASPVATIPWPVRDDTLWLEFDRAGVIDVVMQIHRGGELLYEDVVRATGIPANPAPGHILFVNRRAPEGSTYADFAADAANSIEAALRVAEPNDNIVMAADNYSECAVNLPSGVVLAGLGGRFSADADACPVGFDFSFAAEMQSLGFASTLICNCIENAIVAGLSMRRSDQYCRSGGAASLANSEDIVFENIRFHQNTASEFGGALCLSLSSNIVLSCCIASNNVVDFDDGGKVVCDRGMGGAIAALESSLLVTNCLFDSNAAQVSRDGHAPRAESAGGGGDIYLLRSSLALKQSTLKNSRAGFPIPASVYATSETMTGDGGSILVHGTKYDTILDIADSSFEGCKSYGNGGAIYVAKYSDFKTRTFFSKSIGMNEDVYWITPLLGLSARPERLSGGCVGVFRDTSFTGCQGGWQGGALSANGRTVEMLVTNCVFRECFGGLVHLRDGKGGALALGGGLQSPSDPENCVTMLDCLIDRCAASGNGGGLYVTIRGLLKLGLTDVRNCAALNLGKSTTENFGRIEGMGGGIHISAGGCVEIMSIGDVLFSGNRAAENGGGVSVKSGRLDILGSLLVAENSFTNTPVSGNGNGGGMFVTTSYNDDGFLEAGHSAAELYQEDGTVITLPRRLTICNNSAIRWGGGIYVGIPPTTPDESLYRKANSYVAMVGATIDSNSAAGQAAVVNAFPSQVCLERLTVNAQNPIAPNCGRVILYNSFVTGGGTSEIGAYSFDAPPAITNGTDFANLLYDILVE